MNQLSKSVGAGNPHATFCGNRGRATASGDPVLEVKSLRPTHPPIPVQDPGRGRTKSGRLWVVVRDEGTWGSPNPPAAYYRYSPDRKDEHAQAILAPASGFLHADAYEQTLRTGSDHRPPAPGYCPQSAQSFRRSKHCPREAFCRGKRFAAPKALWGGPTWALLEQDSADETQTVARSMERRSL
ncbi:IS66 family transposase [Bradyrhizobium australafricanum]|uniref:IS66 family transposase n=1 Tax=Bradyrhizobium australafricanum TaxID=2821406 RepID=UPI0035E38FA8